MKKTPVRIRAYVDDTGKHRCRWSVHHDNLRACDEARSRLHRLSERTRTRSGRPSVASLQCLLGALTNQFPRSATHSFPCTFVKQLSRYLTANSAHRAAADADTAFDNSHYLDCQLHGGGDPLTGIPKVLGRFSDFAIAARTLQR